MAADPTPLVRPPPHSVEAEQSVLGSLLLDGESVWNPIRSRISVGDFYSPDHRLIFEAIAGLVAESKPIDVLTVSVRLDRIGKLQEVGGLAYLSTLVRNTPTASNAQAYAQIVHERAMMRRLLQFARGLSAQIDDHAGRSVQEIASMAQEQLLELQAGVREGSGLIPAGVLVGQLLDDLDRRSEGRKGIALGLGYFDELTGGLDAGDLVVLAGRPGMGKTALQVSIAATVARDHQVALFSAEMPALQLMRRCMALASGLSQKQLRRPDQLEEPHWEQISRAAPTLSALRLHVDETAQPTIAHIRAELAALKARSGLGLVLIDYLQLLRASGRNRYEELREVAYGLKALAKDLGVPVIALAQLNRDVEKRGDDKRPNISDLRDSGAIEEAADIIGMLYREAYYNSSTAMPYVLECNVQKHRNGATGQCLWSFAGERSLIVPLDEGAAIQYRRVVAEQSRSRTSGVDGL